MGEEEPSIPFPLANESWFRVAGTNPNMMLGGIKEEYPLLILADEPFTKAASLELGEVLSADLDTLDFLSSSQGVRDLCWLLILIACFVEDVGDMTEGYTSLGTHAAQAAAWLTLDDAEYRSSVNGVRGTSTGAVINTRFASRKPGEPFIHPALGWGTVAHQLTHLSVGFLH